MKKPNYKLAESLYKKFLDALGQDTEREGLKETPKRVVNYLKEFLNPEPFNFTTFEKEKYSGMVISSDIQFFSLCEHHNLPFFGTAAIAYIPNPVTNRIVGISKLPRTLEKHARNFQNQERITADVAAELMNELDALGVAVVIKARHLCQEMRGAKKCGVNTTTSEMLGVFADDINTRNEFLNLINQK